MNQEKIKAKHLEKIAFVYPRQSSPGQVKKNVEGARRQRQMQDQARRLGWPGSRVRLLGGDTGRSGSSLHGRDDYQTILEAVLAGEAGIIFARELSRLVRDNQDWNHLVRLCRYQGVLLGDEHRLYDPADPQDRVVLGIAGAFNEFELAMITERMQESVRQKAERGELYEAFSPGYVCRVEPLYEKHPDQRVQRAIAKVFDEFDRCASVLQLHGELWEQNFQLPVVSHGADWRDVEWVAPRYGQLLYMLKNPVYAGIYARGRKKTFTVLDENGHVKKQRRRMPQEEWEVFLEDHHQPYISRHRWKRNVEKIAANVRGGAAQRAPQEGPSLLAGMLRCRRCGHKFQTRYPKGTVRYTCRSGSRQREASRGTCFSFTGTRVEERVSELILEAVRPAAIEAAVEAAERLAADYQQRRQLIVDRLQARREAEARAAREYKATDSTYAAVRRRLGAEWDEAIQAVEAEQSRLAAFDRDQPVLPTPQQEAELNRLGEELHRIWHHRRASMVLKKQIARTLIEEIVVDLDEASDELTLWIHWAGGHHTELRVARRVRRSRVTTKDLQTLINTLRKVLRDEAIARALNRERIRTPSGETWTARGVRAFRQRQQIAGFSERTKRKHGWLTLAEAANCLGISAMSMTRLVEGGILPAEQPTRGLPGVIRRESLQGKRVQRAIHALKSASHRPLTDDPNQLSLFPVTKS